MIIKFQEVDDPYYIDATMDGVLITRWKHFRRWKDQFYSKIVYR